VRFRAPLLGESYRADAITWMNGLKFGDFEIICWELKHLVLLFKSYLRILEFKLAYFNIKKIIQQETGHDNCRANH
jgi:hypothetical protein